MMAAKTKITPDAADVGRIEKLFLVGGAGVRNLYDVAGDGQSFVINAREAKGINPIHLIVNWPALVAK